MEIFQQIQKKERGNKVSNTQLSIHISRTSVHLAEVLRSNQEIIRLEHTLLHESTPDRFREVIKSFIEEKGFVKDYEEVTAAWSTPKHALIPLRVYNDSDPKSLHTLLFGDAIDARTIDFNRLMELNMVNVFEIPDWVKSLLVIRYPRVTIKHEHALFLRAIFQSSTFDRAIHVSLNDDYMNLSIVHHNELIFSNSFQYQTSDDLLYYTLYVLEQRGFKEEQIKLHGYFVNEAQEKLLHALKELLSKVSGHAIEVGSFNNILTLQTLCV